jgi:hypothetical protein
MSTTPGHDGAAHQGKPGAALSSAVSRARAEQEHARAVTDKAFSAAETVERRADIVVAPDGV